MTVPEPGVSFRYGGADDGEALALSWCDGQSCGSGLPAARGATRWLRELAHHGWNAWRYSPQFEWRRWTESSAGR